MAKLLRGLLLAGLAWILSACGSVEHKQVLGLRGGPPASAQTGTSGSGLRAREIVIFFDGTHNDEVSDTNVKKLHSLVTLQNRPEIFSLYIEGVGTGIDVAGMGAGLGMAARVRLAYDFLLQHYRRGDRIYLVGFSRGAYGARILGSLLYHAGLPPKPAGMSYAEEAEAVFGAVDFHKPYPEPAPPNLEEMGSEQLAQAKLYYARWQAAEQERRRFVREQLEARGLEPTKPVPVHVLALWDTVAAMGFPNWGARTAHKLHAERYYAEVDNPYSRYGDKLCNVEHAFHALSVDDDREWIFTPLPLNRPYLVDGCTPEERGKAPTLANGHLKEVWFPGAHSDVGGGYPDSVLSNTSLNWMMEQLERVARSDGVSILPHGANLREDVYGSSHDPEAGGWSPLYHKINRDLAGYVLGRTDWDYAHLGTRWEDIRVEGTVRQVPTADLCVHQSVFDRRKLAPPEGNENRQLELLNPGLACLGLVTARNQDRRQETKDGRDVFDTLGRFYQIGGPEQDAVCPFGTVAAVNVQKYPNCMPGEKQR